MLRLFSRPGTGYVCRSDKKREMASVGKLEIIRLTGARSNEGLWWEDIGVLDLYIYIMGAPAIEQASGRRHRGTPQSIALLCLHNLASIGFQNGIPFSIRSVGDQGRDGTRVYLSQSLKPLPQCPSPPLSGHQALCLVIEHTPFV